MSFDEMKEDAKELNLDERRRKILDILAVKGKVKVSELSKLFNISEVSIRNDLAELEQAGSLERVHGGAVSTVRAYYNMSFNDRITANSGEKRRISVEAAKLVKDDDSIILNSGTTTLLVARELKNHKGLKVITNAIPVASETGCFNNAQVILLGGNYNPQYYFIYGDDAINQLRKYKAGKLILSIDGVDPEEGITTYLHQEAELVKQMIERVNTTIVVADYTKIGRVSFASVAPLERVDILITDSKADVETLNIIRNMGIEVKVV